MYTTENIHVAAAEPKLGEMKRELEVALSDAVEWYARNQHALEVRYAWWEGQSLDGRKREGRWGKPPFPWEGASDARIRVLDMIINERVELYMTALARMTIQATPTKAQDAELASRLGLLLRWYLSNAMADEMDAELEPLFHFMETFGASVLSVHWQQTLAFEEVTISLEELIGAAQEFFGGQGAQGGGGAMGGGMAAAPGGGITTEGRGATTGAASAIAQLVFDPAVREQAVALVQKMSSMLSKRQAGKVLDDLAKTGAATFKRPYVQEDRPALSALQIFQDVFFPVNTTRLQRARWIAQRELLTEPELREKVEGIEEWDGAFVEKLILSGKGKRFAAANMGAATFEEARRLLGGVWASDADREAQDLFEVFHFYHRASEQNIPAVYRTVFSPQLGTEFYALHEVCPYMHGEYPYVDFVRERHSKTILSSRGLPEVLSTQQEEVKTQRDARTDRASVTTFPPMKRKATMASKRALTYGPGVEIPVLKMDEIEPLTLGAPDMTSIEVEKATLRDLFDYAGRIFEGVDRSTVQKREAALVGRVLRRMQAAGKQMLQLSQQYTQPRLVPRIVGIIPKPVEISREAIAGQFDLILTFDARSADTEYVFGMMERMEKYVLPMDVNAVVNRDVLIRWVMATVDPTLADIVVRPSDTAQVQELEDEQGNIAKMMAGQEPPMKLKGQNFQARLGVLQQALQNPRVLALAQQWPDFGEMLQRRMEFLGQQVNQQQNRLIGVYGTNPSAGSQGVPMLGAPGQMGAS